MHRKRRIVLILLLAIAAIACFLLRSDLFEPLGNKADQNKVDIIEETIAPLPEVVSEPNNEVGSPILEEIEKENPLIDPVLPPSTTQKPISNECFVGGCSSQICSEEQDMVSTCEWRESYACYQTATCERQVSGQCGWSETEELKSCLVNANSQSSLETI
jgi:hypothetical protein